MCAPSRGRELAQICPSIVTGPRKHSPWAWRLGGPRQGFTKSTPFRVWGLELLGPRVTTAWNAPHHPSVHMQGLGTAH